MLYSNYNVLVLNSSEEGKYSVGDIYKAKYYNDSKFDGLKIKNIDFLYGLRLHFDYNEWKDNVPKTH